MHILTVRTYFTITPASDPQTLKPDLPSPSEPYLMIIVGLVIRKNVSTSEPLVPVLDSSKSLAEYINQFALADHSNQPN